MKPIYRYSWDHKDWIVGMKAHRTSVMLFLLSDLIQNYRFCERFNEVEPNVSVVAPQNWMSH